MCTAITLRSEERENFFGRTMDFSYEIEPYLYVVPRDYIWTDVRNINYYNSYSFIAIGQESGDELAFFDGVNEKGFAAAALYFAGYADFHEYSNENKMDYRNHNKKNLIVAYDFVQYILGRCSTVEELIEELQHINIIGVSDDVTRSVAPLHWIATDRSGKCVVIEQTSDGLHAFYNPIGVLANSPDFIWHMTNLRNYMSVSPVQKERSIWGSIELEPFGQGAGTSQLPGGYTSPERFVRAAFHKTHVSTPKSCGEAVITCFHIMESVSIPKGIVITSKDTYDYTKYTAFMNTNTCEYYFRSYENSEITKVCLWNYYDTIDRPINLGNIRRPISFPAL